MRLSSPAPQAPRPAIDARTNLDGSFVLRLPPSLVRNEVTANPYVWGALLVCTGLALLAIYVPPLATVLGLEPPTGTAWALVLGMSALPLLPIQLFNHLRRTES